MKIETIANNDKIFNFILKDINHNFANSLRRTAINNTAVFAIDTVTFYTNTSIKDLGFVVIFRIFEYICIFAFCFWMYKYGK